MWSSVKTPSVILIAVERLGYDSIYCGNDQILNSKDFLGFKYLCQESIRFTHAYTPSVLTQATLSSVLTGKYPFEHGVWHNGNQYLKPSIKTIAEIAIEQGYRTSFFSGGAPVWRKSGLGQGFEYFDDNVSLQAGKIFKPSGDVVESFLDWLKRESSNQPLFSLLFLNDLQFPSEITTNDVGEVRESTVLSQIKEIGENLGYLIEELKKLDRWDNSLIIFFGTNGRSKNFHTNELFQYNLYSEATQVSLYIKPPRKKRDLGIEWKVDKNVSLVDLGKTLLSFFKKNNVQELNVQEESFPTVDLSEIFDLPEVNWDPDRTILIESAWPQWKGLSGSRFSVRKGNYLLIYDEKIQIFNTLADRNEVSPLSSKDPMYDSLKEQLLAPLESQGFIPWTGISSIVKEKYDIAQKIGVNWPLSESNEKKLNNLYKLRMWDIDLVNWMGRLSIEKNLWNDFMTLGANLKNDIWSYVGARHLDLNFPLSQIGCSGIVRYIIEKSKVERPLDCEDEELKLFYSWLKSEDSNIRKKNQISFFRKLKVMKKNKKIELANMRNNFTWDVNDFFELKNIEVLLTLPEGKKIAKRWKIQFSTNDSN